MKQLIATNTFAGHAFMNAPSPIVPTFDEPDVSKPAYFLCSPGFTRIAPGAIIPGPDVDSNTTVCLLDGDDGAWLRKMCADNGGTVTERDYFYE